VHNQTKLVIDLYIAATLLIIINILLRNVKIADRVIKPNGDNFSVLSASSVFTPLKYVVYGFLPYWSLNQTKHVQLSKLTDISYFALRIDKDGNFERDEGYYAWRNNKELEKLIEDSKKFGVRFAVTVISHDDDISTAFLNCPSCWKNFLTALKKELNFHKIQNVNLDFEYAEEVDIDLAAKYTGLVELTNAELDRTYGNSYVTVSTFADAYKRSRLTVPHELNKVADGLFIMAYDFHRPTSETAGPVAPLNGIGNTSDYNISTMLKDYLARVSGSKIILGVPYYGYNWVVNSRNPYAERIPGDDYIGYSGSQAYADIMGTILEYGPRIYWDNVAQVPYFTYTSTATGSTRQTYYENEESLRAKYRLAKKSQLAGIGIWALGYDGGYQELWNVLGEEFPR